MLTTTLVTTTVWILVTLLTAPEPNGILLSFFRKVRPHVTGWRTIAALAPEIPAMHDLGRNLTSEIGIKYLGYIGNTYLKEFPGCPAIPEA